MTLLKLHQKLRMDIEKYIQERTEEYLQNEKSAMFDAGIAKDNLSAILANEYNYDLEGFQENFAFDMGWCWGAREMLSQIAVFISTQKEEPNANNK